MLRLKWLILVFILPTHSTWADNVILMIGDGMGQGVITATRAYYLNSRGELFLDQLPHTAIVRTHSHSHIVTDSAAAATAMASGRKVQNGVINQDESASQGKPWGENKPGKKIVPITEIAKKRGYQVAIVTNTRVTHATPAAFYGSTHDRMRSQDLVKDILETKNFDFLLGGGMVHFDEKVMPKIKEKYDFFTSFSEAQARGKKKEKPLLGIFAQDHIPYLLNDPKAIRLKDLAGWTLDQLIKESADFFMMIEGGKIDHALHENDVANALSETREFDLAVGEVLKRIQSHPRLKQNTLLLVTADHDTAGLAINGYPRLGFPLIKDRKVMPTVFPPQPDYSYDSIRFVTGQKVLGTAQLREGLHTANDVPLYAWGKGADKVRGTIQNTGIFQLIRQGLGL